VDALITDDVGGVRAALRHRATSGTRATPCAAR
jgi:hypothetical protein